MLSKHDLLSKTILSNRADPNVRPPNVTDLPLIENGVFDLPDGVEARLLDGNWYGNGPEIVLHEFRTQRYNCIALINRVKLPVALVQLVGSKRSAGCKAPTW